MSASFPDHGAFSRLLADASCRIAFGRSRRLALFVAIALLVALGANTVFRAAYGVHDHSDYTVYTAAGRAVLEGSNIYEAHNARGWNYVYLPLFAIVMAPFARLPVALGSAAWYVTCVIAIASALVMSMRIACAQFPALRTSGARGWMVPLALVSPWLVSGLTRGQASELMIWLVIAAIYWDLRDRQTWAGTALAAAALLKAFPAALVICFVARRRWRFVAAFTAATLVGLLVVPGAWFGWQKNLDYLDQWHALVAAPVVARSGSTPADPMHEQLLDMTRQRNQSLQALFVSAGLSLADSRLAMAVTGVLMLIVMLRGRGNVSAAPWLASAFIAWNLMIAPISESHYFGLLLLPMSQLHGASRAHDDRAARNRALALLVVFAVLTPVVSLYKPLQLYRPLCLIAAATWVWAMIEAGGRRVS